MEKTNRVSEMVVPASYLDAPLYVDWSRVPASRHASMSMHLYSWSDIDTNLFLDEIDRAAESLKRASAIRYTLSEEEWTKVTLKARSLALPEVWIPSFVDQMGMSAPRRMYAPEKLRKRSASERIRDILNKSSGLDRLFIRFNGATSSLLQKRNEDVARFVFKFFTTALVEVRQQRWWMWDFLDPISLESPVHSSRILRLLENIHTSSGWEAFRETTSENHERYLDIARRDLRRRFRTLVRRSGVHAAISAARRANTVRHVSSLLPRRRRLPRRSEGDGKMDEATHAVAIAA